MKRQYRWSVDGEAFKHARLTAAFSKREAAELLGVTQRTVRNWEAQRSRVPYSAFKLLRILSGYVLPGEAWAGWCIRGDTLWSPEQRPFRPHEVNWWGLVVAMARQFAIEHGAANAVPVNPGLAALAAVEAQRVAQATAAGNPQCAPDVAGAAGSSGAPAGDGGLPAFRFPSPRAVIRGESQEVFVSLGRG